MLTRSPYPELSRVVAMVVALLIIFPVAACGGGDVPGKVDPPLSASEVKGKKYQDVVARFENAGFTNVTTEAVADLVIGLFAGDDEVKDVSIAGDSDYTANEKFAPDAQWSSVTTLFQRKSRQRPRWQRPRRINQLRPRVCKLLLLPRLKKDPPPRRRRLRQES